jgi:hypothetical protein
MSMPQFVQTFGRYTAALPPSASTTPAAKTT